MLLIGEVCANMLILMSVFARRGVMNSVLDVPKLKSFVPGDT